MYVFEALTRIQNKTFLPFGSYASISDLYVFPMSPPNMYQTPSIANDLASLKSNKVILLEAKETILIQDYALSVFNTKLVYTGELGSIQETIPRT